MCPTTIARGSGDPMAAGRPGSTGVEEEVGEALCKLREEAAWLAWMEEGGAVALCDFSETRMGERDQMEPERISISGHLST